MLKTFLAVLVSALACGASAQDYPSRPVRVIVPFAPGGGTDILVRILAPRLSAAFNQQVVVENRPGAGSMIGTGEVVRSAPDGYTVIAVDTSFTVNPSLQARMPYDSLKDLAPVIHLAAAPVILVAHPSLPAKSVKELVALAKSKPGSLAYASGGNGASTHLAGELLKMVAGIDLVHVPYKGTGPAIADVVGGQVQLNFAGISSARQHIESGRLRGIAVTGERRNAALPDVPTFVESGLAGVDAGTHWGLLVPAGTPAEVIRRLNAEVHRALQQQDVKARVAELGFEAAGGPPEAWADLIRSEMAKWAKVVKEARIKLD